ncbi:hypothetical protein CEUSTIGMA_g13045.t1 [Chlamydomonas eustigma]|uniref:Xaa-Pro dipeptidase n=1 Tax=Chlamydomonas eustigma TaxID=1157962 RepID=A0A250XS54_9CHLO|nr:hypothetical protein CEUSTIGMA_g13045.t1 [Chlamydomonas eustigma]|eukprot:GAX85630.1 hypothetical protein CEUSTIGMA_g13045.t1 [Chlamydomonas eustigma]
MTISTLRASTKTLTSEKLSKTAHFHNSLLSATRTRRNTYGHINCMAVNKSHVDIYNMGAHTLSISRKQLHGEIRSKVVAAMHKAIPDPTKRGVALLQGGATFQLYSSDGEMLFKQDSYFFYLFGVSEDSWYGALNMQTGKSTLFMPRLPDSYAVWMGPLKSPEYYLGRYGVDEVLYVDEMSKWLETAVGKHQGLPIHVLSGTNTDSGMEFVSPKLPVEATEAATLEMEKDTLFNAITESRVRKTPEEIAIIRYANQVGSKAHVELMRTCKPGDMEYHLESRFLSYCYSTGGSRSPMYGPISASGPNGAILHYGHAGAPNDRQMQEGDMVLVDMG